MITTVAPDMTVHVVSDDGEREFRLPAYDPRTMAPFASAEEAGACAAALAGHPDVWTPVPTEAERLEAARAAKLGEIIAAGDALLAGGYPAAGGLHVAMDDGSRADLTAMAATAIAAASGAIPWPESYAAGWISIENTRIPLAAPADGLALSAAAGAWYASVVQHRRTLKDAALAAADEAALARVDPASGWPA